MAMNEVNKECIKFKDAIIKSKGDFEKVKEAYRKFYKYYKNDRLEYAERALGQLKKAKYKIKTIDKVKECAFLKNFKKYDHNNLAIDGKGHLVIALGIFLREFRNAFGETKVYQAGNALLESIRKSRKDAIDSLNKILELFVKVENARLKLELPNYMQTRLTLTPEDPSIKEYKDLMEDRDDNLNEIIPEWQNTIEEILDKTVAIHKNAGGNRYYNLFTENAKNIINLNLRIDVGRKTLDYVTNSFENVWETEGKDENLKELIDNLKGYRDDIKDEIGRFESAIAAAQNKYAQKQLNFLKNFPLKYLKNTYEIKDTNNNCAKEYVDMEESLNDELDEKGGRLKQLRKDALKYMNSMLKKLQKRYDKYKLQKGDKIIGYKWLDEINKAIKADKGKEKGEQKFTPEDMAEKLEKFAEDVLKIEGSFNVEKSVNKNLKDIVKMLKKSPSPSTGT